MIPHAPLPDFEPSDRGGPVYTTLPPNQVIPPRFTDPAWLRADFSGVTIPGDYEPKFLRPDGTYDEPRHSAAIEAAGGVRITSGRWKGLWIPFPKEANSTPPTMIMTPQLPLFPRDVQEAFLTEYCERAYDDFVYAPDGWALRKNGFDPTPEAMRDWVQFIKSSWGLRPVYWNGDARDAFNPVFHTLFDADLVSFYVHGKEVETSWDRAEDYEASLQRVDQFIGGRLPIGVHFAPDGNPASHHFGLGYPVGFTHRNGSLPSGVFLPDWSPYDGRVHLCQQVWPWASAGTQTAALYYAVRHINEGIGDAAKPGAKGAPNSRVIAFETLAEGQLYGDFTEEQGCLRSLELLCGTWPDLPRGRAVSGFGNGCRNRDGSVR